MYVSLHEVKVYYRKDETENWESDSMIVVLLIDVNFRDFNPELINRTLSSSRMSGFGLTIEKVITKVYFFVKNILVIRKIQKLVKSPPRSKIYPNPKNWGVLKIAKSK